MPQRIPFIWSRYPESASDEWFKRLIWVFKFALSDYERNGQNIKCHMGRFFADFQHTMIEDHCVMAAKGKEGGEGV